MRIDRIYELTGPGLIDFAILRGVTRLRAARAMYDMGDTLHCSGQAFWLRYRTGTNFNFSQMPLYKSRVGGVPDQDGGLEAVSLERVENMAAHKPAGACDQNLQSNQPELFADLA